MKSTKKALTASVLSVAVCASMLVGSTFAWFTDSVTSGKNQIVAGNLDVELEYMDENGDYQPVETDTNLFMEGALWEPGHTEVVNLKVSNLGSLALKYRFSVNIEDEEGSRNVNGDSFKLSDYILFSVLDGEQIFNKDDAGRQEAIAAAEDNAQKISEMTVKEDGVLYSTDEATQEIPSEKYVTLVVYMPTSVGNEANHQTGKTQPSIELGVSLVATQVEYEQDSFGNDYDKGTTLNFKHVSSYEDVNSHLEDGKTYVVANDVQATAGRTSTFYFKKCKTTLALNGATVTAPAVKPTGQKDPVAAISVGGDDSPATLTIDGNGIVDGGSGSKQLNAAVKVNPGSTVIIKGGTYTTGASENGNGCPVIFANGGHAEIYGGFFYTDYMANGVYWVLNCQDKTDASIKVYGGTFVNFNPADNSSEGPNTNYVAEGYTVVSETQANGDIWYTVVPE